MKDLYTKCKEYETARQAEAMGLHPYFKVISSNAEGGTVTMNGKTVVMAGSNNYLGLTQHPKVKAAALKAIEDFGTGCSGSRFLNGTLNMHVELEERLASFLQQESALVFSTGFQANLGTISCLVGPDDIVFSDDENHASIVEGCRLALGTTVVYKHNDMDHLEKLLIKHKETSGKLIVTDGVFSMSGDVAKLDKIVKLAKKYSAKVMLDDAHGLGVLGKQGRGTADHFKVLDQVDIIMGTFSKSFASLGGFIVASEETIHYIKHHARAFIFSASMPPAAVASVLAVLDILETEDEHLERLWKNSDKIRKGFNQLGFDTTPSTTPVIPVNIGDDLRTLYFAKNIFDAGVFTNPVLPPGVPKEKSLIRTSYMSTHTDKELDFILGAFEKTGKLCELIH